MATGRNVDGDQGADCDACGPWMLMGGIRAEVPGGYRWEFKRRHYGNRGDHPKNESIRIPASGGQLRDLPRWNPELHAQLRRSERG